MSREKEFDRYQDYVSRFEADLKATFVGSVEKAEAGWGVRRLTRLEFGNLIDAASEDPVLRERWLTRLELGYDREKTRLADEVEDAFADFAAASQLFGRREDAA